MSAHSPLLHWLYDPEGYLKPFRGLEPPSFFDATTLLPSGITPGFAFHEVREWNDDIEFTSPPPGREFRGKGIFGSNTDGWIDPDVLSSLRRQVAIPIWDRKKMLYVDWELLYIDWYENTGRWFEMGYQLKLLVATQPEDRQVELITQIRQERLRIGEVFQLLRLYGRRHQNPYVPGNVFKALALPGSLQGQVGPEEWYNFFVRFLKHGRRTAAYGGTSMWEAHSVLIGAIIAYTSKMRPEEPWFQIKNDLLQIQAARGNKKFTYIELFMFVMPRLLAVRDAEWVEQGVIDGMHAQPTAVSAVSNVPSRTENRSDYGSQRRPDERRTGRSGERRYSSGRGRGYNSDRDRGYRSGRSDSESRKEKGYRSGHSGYRSGQGSGRYRSGRSGSEGRDKSHRSPYKDRRQYSKGRGSDKESESGTDRNDRQSFREHRSDGKRTDHERRSSGNGTDRGSTNTRTRDRDGKRSSGDERGRDRHYRKTTADTKGPGATAVCFRCGGRGHMAAQCPTPSRYARENARARSVQDESASAISETPPQTVLSEDSQPKQSVPQGIGRQPYARSARPDKHVRWLQLPPLFYSQNQGVEIRSLDFETMPSVTRSPIKPPNKYHSGKSELLFHVRISFQDQLLLPETEVLTLADIGCQVLAVGPSKFFPKASWVDAPRPLRLLGAGKSQITGGDKGVIVNMSLPVTGKRGVVIFQCLNVFIHLADVGDKILLGFPFFQQYRLAFLPNQKFLVPMEELKMVKYPSRYQGLCPKCHGDQTACPCVHQRVLVSILKQSGHGQLVLEQKSVRFSEPLVADWWCPECNPTAPPQALSACTHYGHVVCINHLERIWFEKICSREYDQVFLLQDGSSLQVKRLQDDVILPKQATGDSAGYDLFSPVSVSIPAQSGVKIPLHISMAIPMGHYGRIASRSSFAAQRVHVAGGVIDRGYRGDVTVLLENSGDQPFTIQKGDRIAQLILEKHSTPSVVEAKELSTTERGTGGFGSTGRSQFIPPQENSSLTNQTNSTHPQSFDCFVSLFILFGILQKMASDSLSTRRDATQVSSQTVRNVEREAPQVRESSSVGREVPNRSAMKREASGSFTVSGSLQQECDALQMANDSLSMGREVLGLVRREAPITMSDRNDLSAGASDSLNLVMFVSSITALACRLFSGNRSIISPVYPTSDSSCTEATDSILCQVSQDFLSAGGTREASQIDRLYADQWGHRHEAWAPDYFMAAWGYARCIDYRDTKILSYYDSQLRQDNRIFGGLTELILTSLQGSDPFPTATTPQPPANKFITPALNTMLRRQVKRIKPGHVRVRSDVIDRVSAWMTDAGMSVTVDAFGCPNFQAFPQTWTDPQQ